MCFSAILYKLFICSALSVEASDFEDVAAAKALNEINDSIIIIKF